MHIRTTKIFLILTAISFVSFLGLSASIGSCQNCGDGDLYSELIGKAIVIGFIIIAMVIINIYEQQEERDDIINDRFTTR